MSEIKYHGHTLKDINDRYFIHYEGTEEYYKIRMINAKLAQYWQEVSDYYKDSKRRLDRAKSQIRRAEEQLQLDKSKTQSKYIKENRSLEKTKKWTDKARETLSITESMTPDMIKTFNDLEEEKIGWEEEVMIWHEVRQNLKFISSRIDNDSMNNAVERKITNNFQDNPKDTLNEKVTKKIVEDDKELPF